jgi:uncharacterized protein YkwD
MQLIPNHIMLQNLQRKLNDKIFILTLCASLLFSCGPHTTPPGSRDLIQRPQPTINIGALEKQIHTGINRERQKQGLPRLAWDDALVGIARSYSKDMATRKYFDHYSPEGHDFLHRYKQAGYECAVRIQRTMHMGGENIALNHLYDSVTTVNGQAFYDWNSQDKIAETTVQGWMKSPGHRQNILTPYFQHEGIGIFIDSKGNVYITQNFC